MYWTLSLAMACCLHVYGTERKHTSGSPEAGTCARDFRKPCRTRGRLDEIGAAQGGEMRALVTDVNAAGLCSLLTYLYSPLSSGSLLSLSWIDALRYPANLRVQLSAAKSTRRYPRSPSPPTPHSSSSFSAAQVELFACLAEGHGTQWRKGAAR